jgi:hypothetical protein
MIEREDGIRGRTQAEMKHELWNGKKRLGEGMLSSVIICFRVLHECYHAYFAICSPTFPGGVLA